MAKILIVEDHGVVRAGIKNLLQQEASFEIVGTVENARQALALLKNGLETDIVLTDLHLGDMTGIDLARIMQQMAPQVKIVMLTMDASEHYLSEAFKAGIKGYLLKETDSDELIYAIRKVMQGKYFICTGLAARLSERMARERPYPQDRTEIELSERETEVLHLLADGLTNIEIADRLFTSKRTVEGHRLSLLQKTGARNGPELIKLVMLNGLLNIPATS